MLLCPVVIDHSKSLWWSKTAHICGRETEVSMGVACSCNPPPPHTHTQEPPLPIVLKICH